MSNYTEKMVAELEAKASWTYAEAVAYAEANGLKPRSVIAKIKSLKLGYVAKPVRVTKQGEPVVLKAELVAAIESALGIKAPSLAKVAKADLEALATAVVKGTETAQAA